MLNRERRNIAKENRHERTTRLADAHTRRCLDTFILALLRAGKSHEEVDRLCGEYRQRLERGRRT